MHAVSILLTSTVVAALLVPNEAKFLFAFLVVLAIGYVLAEHVVQHKAF